jgi:hypothetical protein
MRRKADKALTSEYGNQRLADPKSNLTRFEPGGYYNPGDKLRSTRFYITYNNYGDETTKPEAKHGKA